MAGRQQPVLYVVMPDRSFAGSQMMRHPIGFDQHEAGASIPTLDMDQTMPVLQIIGLEVAAHDR